MHITVKCQCVVIKTPQNQILGSKIRFWGVTLPVLKQGPRLLIEKLQQQLFRRNVLTIGIRDLCQR
jgi:hypothetical protein